MKKYFFRHRDFIIAVFLALAIGIWFGIFAVCGVDSHHDGIIFKPSLDVANGFVLFRDTFFHYGIALPYFFGVLLKIFGPYLIVIKLATVGAYMITAFLMYLVWRKIMPPLFAAAAILLWFPLAPFYGNFIFMPWSSVFAAMSAAAMLLLLLQKRTAAYAAAAGICGALIFLFRQPVGMVSMLGMALFFLFCFLTDQTPEQRKKTRFRAGGFLLGEFASIGIALCALWHAGALADWFQQTIVYPSNWSQNLPGGTPSPQHCLFPLSNWYYLLLPLLILLAGWLTLYRCHRQKRRSLFSERMLLLTLAGGASWAQYYPINCIRHFFWSALQMTGFYPFWLWIPGFLMKKHRRLGGILPLIVFFFLLLFFWESANPDVPRLEEKLRYHYSHGHIFSEGPLRGMRLPSFFYTAYKKMWDLHQALPPGYPYVNNSRDAIYNTFYQSSRELRPMYVNWGNTVYPDYEQKKRDFILQNHPVILTGDGNYRDLLVPRQVKVPKK